MTLQENKKFSEEKERKMKVDLDTIKAKHNLEIKVLQLKTTSVFNEYKSNRSLNFDIIIQKFKNKLKELENQQKLETNTLFKMSNILLL